MYQITRQLKDFSAAHRLINGYQGKCQHLHGHNYQVQVTLGAKELSQYGFVADFQDVKTICDAWVDANLDHTTIVIADDRKLIAFLEENEMKHYVLHGYQNSTAESLAHYLFHIFKPLIRELGEIELLSVEVAETRQCKAAFVATESLFS